MFYDKRGGDILFTVGLLHYLMKTTLVLGATTNPSRYAYKAIEKLKEKKITVYAVGIKQGSVFGVEIKREFPNVDIDTVTLYVGKERQEEYISKIIALKPSRIIFNPGTENESFFKLAKSEGIEVVEACTLVLLSIGNY